MCTGLYARLLGFHCDELAGVVRKLHGRGGMVCIGVFQIRHGCNPIARTLARLAKLPTPGDDVKLRLIITPSPCGERWQRFFAGKLFSSLQEAVDGSLIEQIGPIEIRFRLQVSRGALHYRTEGAAIRLGPFRVPLPRMLAPHISASEAADGDCVRVAVEVRVPLFGLLIAYEGMLTSIEATS